MSKLVFENIIKEKVRGFEAPLNSGAWENFSSNANLPAKGSGIITGTALKITLIASLFVIPAVGIYFLMDYGKEQRDQLLHKDEVKKEIIVSDKSDEHEKIRENVVNSVEHNEASDETLQEAKEKEYVFKPINDGKLVFFGPTEANMKNIKKFRMLIRDESGKLIFESNNSYDLWNGKIQNTEMYAKNGYYDWFIVIVKSDDEVYRKRGKVKLLR
jgi:hypothetical protein